MDVLSAMESPIQERSNRSRLRRDLAPDTSLIKTGINGLLDDDGSPMESLREADREAIEYIMADDEYLDFADEAEHQDALERARESSFEEARQLARAQKIKSHRVSANDQTFRTHPKIDAWCESQGHSGHADSARVIILQLVQQDQQRGWFSYSTEVVKNVLGTKVYEIVGKFCRKFAKIIKGYSSGNRCYHWSIDLTKLDGLVVNESFETPETYSDIGSSPESGSVSCWNGKDFCNWVWKPLDPVFVRVSGSWLEAYRLGWASLALIKDWVLGSDFFGVGLYRGVQKALRSLRFDDFNESCPAYVEPCEWESKHRDAHREIYDRILSRNHANVVSRKRFRLYSWVTSLPKSIRRRSMWIDGERPKEVDLHAAYWCGLASRVTDDEERSRLIALLSAGKLYRFFNLHTSGQFDSNIKVETNRQCLFWEPSDQRQRPIWDVLCKFFPNLARFIRWYRKHKGVSGLSDRCMQLESSVMFKVFEILSDEGLSFLPLHDAALVPESVADHVKRTMERVGFEVLGFTPRVKLD